MYSEKFDLVNKYYKTHLWTLEQTRNAVKKGWITEEEFQEITDERY